MSWLKQRTDPPFLHLFVLFRPSGDWTMPTHVGTANLQTLKGAHSRTWPPCSRAGALAHSWCLINVCQDGIREKPADRWRRLPDGQKRLQPSRSLCFPGKTIRAEGEGWADPAPSPTPPTPASRSIFWTHDRQRESSQCPWRCGPCQPTADGWPEDCKGVYVREETGTNGRRATSRGHCHL